MIIGPATQSALDRITSALPYALAEGAAVPAAQRDSLAAIQAKYAANHVSQTGQDPKLEAAKAWAREELAKALEADGSSENEKADEIAFEQPIEPEPPKQEPTYDELERLTATATEEGK